MKKFMFLLLLGSQTVLADTITFRADNWCPFNCEPKSKTPGYIVEILNQTLGKAGHVIDYQILAWNRALLEVADGKFNAVIGSSSTDLKDGINSVPVGVSKSCFFVKKDQNFSFTGVASLTGKKVGIIKGYTYDTEIDADIAKRPAGYDVGFGEDPLVLNIRKLEAGRVDLVLENEAVFNYTAGVEKMGSNFKSAGCVADMPQIHISFNSKNSKHAEYVKIINEGIESLRKSGELKTILSKYNAADWK